MRYPYRLDRPLLFALLCLSVCALPGSAQQPLPEPPAQLQRYPLNEQATQLAQTAEGREFVQYLAGCALCEGVTAFVDVEGQHYEFPGAIGLAPQWIHHPLSEEEQRWVSACMLARTNYFGVEVKISLRNENSPVAALQTTAEERADFTIYEGDFFGNLFADPPVAGVALGHRSPEQQSDPVLQLRVCTAADTSLTPIDGHPLSRCRFIITGYADEPEAHTLGGQQYDQYIRVYLKLQAPNLTPQVPQSPAPGQP